MQQIMQKLKNPVSTLLEMMKQENLKKGLIKGAIIAVAMSIISAISNVISTYVKYSERYDYYEGAEKAEKVWDKIKDLEVFSGIIQSIITIAIIIAVVALILFIIAKMVKSAKKYEEMLSLVNNTAIIMAVGNVANMIISIIYAPLGMLVMVAASIYAFFALICAFRESMEVEDLNALVIATTIVITVAMALIMIIITALLKEALGGLMDLDDIMSIM